MLQTIESANADSFRGLRCNNSSRQIIYSLKEGRRKRLSSGRRWYARPQSSDGHHAVAAKAPTGDGEVRPRTEPICGIGLSIGFCEWDARHDVAHQISHRALY